MFPEITSIDSLSKVSTFTFFDKSSDMANADSNQTQLDVNIREINDFVGSVGSQVCGTFIKLWLVPEVAIIGHQSVTFVRFGAALVFCPGL